MRSINGLCAVRCAACSRTTPTHSLDLSRGLKGLHVNHQRRVWHNAPRISRWIQPNIYSCVCRWWFYKTWSIMILNGNKTLDEMDPSGSQSAVMDRHCCILAGHFFFARRKGRSGRYDALDAWKKLDPKTFQRRIYPNSVIDNQVNVISAGVEGSSKKGVIIANIASFQITPKYYYVILYTITLQNHTMDAMHNVPVSRSNALSERNMRWCEA